MQDHFQPMADATAHMSDRPQIGATDTATNVTNTEAAARAAAELFCEALNGIAQQLKSEGFSTDPLTNQLRELVIPGKSRGKPKGQFRVDITFKTLRSKNEKDHSFNPRVICNADGSYEFRTNSHHVLAMMFPAEEGAALKVAEAVRVKAQRWKAITKPAPRPAPARKLFKRMLGL